MPGMGMHLGLYQAMELRQELALRLEMRMELDPYAFGAQPFRTEEEIRQVSQYEVLEKLSKVLSDGEFIDPDHFELETNRSIFGHRLQADLGNFGRELAAVINGYRSDDKTAERIVKALASQKAKDKKETPGRIAAGLNKVLSSDYFKKEPKEKTVLGLVEKLNGKDVDTAEAMDVVGEVSSLEDQKHFVDATVARIGRYADEDSRIIPFSNNVLRPVLKSVKTRKESLTPEQSEAVFTEVVEYLFMLDREGRVSGGAEKIAGLISKYGPQILLDRNLPLPLRAFLENLSKPETTQNLMRLFSDREFAESRELKRRVYNGFHALEETERGEEILNHIAANAKSPNSVARILEAVNLVYRDPEFSYPFDLTDEDQILRNLRLILVDKSLKRIGLPDDRLEQYIEGICKNPRLERIGKILTTLGSYQHYQTPQQLSLIREILIAEIDGKSREWRYSHDLAGEQLACLEDDEHAVSVWEENKSVKRLVGELDALKSHIESVKHALPKMVELYKGQYRESFEFSEEGSLVVADDYLSGIEKEIEENEEKLRDSETKGHEKKELGYKTSLLREKLAYARLLKSITGLAPENYSEALAQADELTKRKSKNPLMKAPSG